MWSPESEDFFDLQLLLSLLSSFRVCLKRNAVKVTVHRHIRPDRSHMLRELLSLCKTASGVAIVAFSGFLRLLNGCVFA